jgi:hypothetical protein
MARLDDNQHTTLNPTYIVLRTKNIMWFQGRAVRGGLPCISPQDLVVIVNRERELLSIPSQAEIGHHDGCGGLAGGLDYQTMR